MNRQQWLLDNKPAYLAWKKKHSQLRREAMEQVRRAPISRNYTNRVAEYTTLAEEAMKMTSPVEKALAARRQQKMIDILLSNPNTPQTEIDRIVATVT
jgi:hypothetical protein